MQQKIIHDCNIGLFTRDSPLKDFLCKWSKLEGLWLIPWVKLHIYSVGFQNKVKCQKILWLYLLSLGYEMHPSNLHKIGFSHLDFPKILKISLSNGVAVFLLNILVFNNLKSTTGLLFLVPFLATSITGEVCVVLFLERIPRETTLDIYLSMRGLSSSCIGKGLTKNGESSTTSISILMLGHLPISSLRLKASFVLLN